MVATDWIPVGTIIWAQCALDRAFTPAQLAAYGPDYRHLLARYCYRDHTGDFVLAWDHGRYVNHSCDAPVRGLGHGAQIVVRDIEPGDAVTCDYGECNLESALCCACDTPQCRGVICADDVLTYADAWDKQVAQAIRAAARVKQPLSPFWLDETLDTMIRRRGAPSIRHLHFKPAAQVS